MRKTSIWMRDNKYRLKRQNLLRDENGKLILSLPLSENTKQTIRCTDEGSNQFLIQDGAVTMTDADCGDKTCVKTGPIKEAGQSIVCLPHRLVITITDSSSDSAPDAIVR